MFLFLSFNLLLVPFFLFLPVVDLVIFVNMLFHIRCETLPFLIMMILTTSFPKFDLTLRMILSNSRLLSFCLLGRYVSTENLFHIESCFPLRFYPFEEVVPLRNEIFIIDAGKLRCYLVDNFSVIGHRLGIHTK